MATWGQVRHGVPEVIFYKRKMSSLLGFPGLLWKDPGAHLEVAHALPAPPRQGFPRMGALREACFLWFFLTGRAKGKSLKQLLILEEKAVLLDGYGITVGSVRQAKWLPLPGSLLLSSQHGK